MFSKNDQHSSGTGVTPGLLRITIEELDELVEVMDDGVTWVKDYNTMARRRRLCYTHISEQRERVARTKKRGVSINR